VSKARRRRHNLLDPFPKEKVRSEVLLSCVIHSCKFPFSLIEYLESDVLCVDGGIKGNL
jgi:hypothetical protein